MGIAGVAPCHILVVGKQVVFLHADSKVFLENKENINKMCSRKMVAAISASRKYMTALGVTTQSDNASDPGFLLVLSCQKN